jgi:hypothetical protein
MKRGRPGFGRAAYDLLLVLVRLSVIWDQAQVNGAVEITRILPDAWRQLLAKDAVQAVLQTGAVWQRPGQYFSQTMARRRMPQLQTSRFNAPTRHIGVCQHLQDVFGCDPCISQFQRQVLAHHRYEGIQHLLGTYCSGILVVGLDMALALL